MEHAEPMSLHHSWSLIYAYEILPWEKGGKAIVYIVYKSTTIERRFVLLLLLLLVTN